MEKNRFYSEIMKNKKEIINYVFNFTGGTQQVLSHVNKVEQHFHGYPFGEVVLSESFSKAIVTQVVSSGSLEPEAEAYADSMVIARGELRIYYPDDAAFQAITTRLGDCKDAIELANVVVNEMMEHTILNQATVMTAHFIGALLEFTHFTKGTSVSNIRQHIQKLVVTRPQKRREK